MKTDLLDIYSDYLTISHAKDRHVKGINLLSFFVRYGGIALPIGCDVTIFTLIIDI